MTIKPMLYVANVGEEDVAGAGERAKSVHEHAKAMGSEAITLCGDLECELVGMEPADRATFMADYGLKELSLGRLIRATYSLLGLQTFFTAGKIEIRAWTIHKGDTGPVAAGVIHTDFEKGYVRAEIYTVEDLEQFHTEPAIKSHGKMRTEGRDYVMREGDICHFLISK
jgi:ribosome-binding ATPase YchF (GTP1/OBG family)